MSCKQVDKFEFLFEKRKEITLNEFTVGARVRYSEFPLIFV